MASYDCMMAGMAELSTSNARRTTLTAALLQIVSERGLDQVSVREVAAVAGVSAGTVQYYFPTKDAMLVAAFDEVVERIRQRMSSISFGADVRVNLSRVLREVLPLDARRAEETRISLAFSARAAIAPDLARIQKRVLGEIVDALADAFSAAAHGRANVATCRRAAHIAVAAADGLAMHAVSSGGAYSARHMAAALEQLLDALVAGIAAEPR